MEVSPGPGIALAIGLVFSWIIGWLFSKKEQQ